MSFSVNLIMHMQVLLLPVQCFISYITAHVCLLKFLALGN